MKSEITLLTRFTWLLAVVTLSVGCASNHTSYMFADDGSGTLTYSVDIGPMMYGLQGMFSSDGQDVNGNDQTTNPMSDHSTDQHKDQEEILAQVETESKPPSLEDTFKDMIGELFQMDKVDTTIHIFTHLPDEAFDQLSHPEYIERITFHFDIDKAQDRAQSSIIIRFDELSQVNLISAELVTLIALMDDQAELQPQDLEQTSLLDDKINFDLDQRVLSKPSDPHMLTDIFESEEVVEMYKSLDEGQLNTMLDVMGFSDIKVSYHLPYPIHSVETDLHYKLYNNAHSIDLHYSVRDMLTSEVDDAYIIKF